MCSKAIRNNFNTQEDRKLVVKSMVHLCIPVYTRVNLTANGIFVVLNTTNLGPSEVNLRSEQEESVLDRDGEYSHRESKLFLFLGAKFRTSWKFCCATEAT